MQRKSNFIWLGMALLVTLSATSALAGPIITVDPVAAGPINCSDSATFTVHYNPNDYTGELAGFTLVLANGAGDYVTFDDAIGSSDVSLLDWPGGFFQAINNGTYQVAVDGAVLGGTNLPALTEADLFNITLHGDATGAGELNLVSVILRDPTNSTIPHDAYMNPMAGITVDCDAPPVPVMVAEPAFTAGTENQVFWGAVMDPSGGVEYNVRADDGVNPAVESGWISATDFLFTGLVHGDSYVFDVQARDGLGNESVFSATVTSTQDAGYPESAVGALLPAYGTWTLNIPWTASDDLSGVAHVELMYQVDGGGFMPYGTTFNTSPITFIATVDGDYEFYTLATDVANNVEQNPEVDSQITTLDTTPPVAPTMHPEPPFTQGTENLVSWDALADATEYEVRINGGVTSSGWIAPLEFTFSGLSDGLLYTYEVRARDALLNVGPWSAPVESSMQDDTKPTSIITAPASGNMSSLSIPITVTASDAVSGVATVRLFYNLNTTAWIQFGDGFAPGTPIPFVAPGDGSCVLYSVAEDAVGNVEDAPGTPDVTYLIDTAGPVGTFVINADAVYTTSATVTLNSVFADVNGVTLMRFSTDNVTWGVGWVPYAEIYPSYPLLPIGDGLKTVYAQYQDGTGNISSAQDDIILDTIAPPAVSMATPVAGHENIGLSWTETDPGDLAVIEIWASLYDDVHDAVGVSTYPEYNDQGIWPAPGNTGGMPTVPLHLDPDADWYLLATVPVGTGIYDHAEPAPWARACYSYYMFARDFAGNYSPANSQWSRKAVNYVLGDFDGDGTIAIGADVSPFAAAYGTVDGDAAYQNIFDIGPVSGGYPSTDNLIAFEDLMILSLNFNAQSKAAVGQPETPVLTWYQVEENTWVLGLVDATNSLKGVRLASALPTNVTIDARLSSELGNGFFLGNDARNGMDLGFAVLGHNSVFPGSGEILRVTTSEPVDLSGITVQVRDYMNETIEFELQAEPLVVLPSVYSLDNNYPNPFNPETTIKFGLPEAQDVRLEIFNIKGARVRTLVDEGMAAGMHSVIWNGRDQGGRSVASGTYFYRIQAGPLNQVHRMLLVK